MHWAGGLLALALLPKCVACLAAYAAIGAGFGALAAEVCGTPTARESVLAFVFSPMWIGGWCVVAFAFAAGRWLRRRHRRLLAPELTDRPPPR